MYKVTICLKYLLSRRFVSIAAVLAIAGSVALLIIVMAVMEGFKETMRDRIRGTLAHLCVEHFPVALAHWEDLSASIEDLDHVQATAPYVETITAYRIATPSGDAVDWGILRGVDPVLEARVGRFGEYLLRPEELEEFFDQIGRIGRREAQPPARTERISDDDLRRIFSLSWRRRLIEERNRFSLDEALEGFGDAPPQPIVVGIEAVRSGRFREGQIVTLTSFSPTTGDARKGQFMVVGAFKTGLYEHDLRTIYTTLPAACEFVGSYDPDLEDLQGNPVGGYRVSGVSIALDDYRNADRVKREIYAEVLPTFSRFHLGGAKVQTWEEQRENLLRAVSVEKGIIALILLILVGFASALIFLVLTLQLIEKTRDLGILQAIGATPGGILIIFLMVGLIISSVGLGLGIAGGVVFAGHINPIHDQITAWTGWELFPRDIYYLDRIPVYLNLGDLVLYLVLTVFMGFVGSLLPAAWAAGRDPIRAIRYE
ncbi:MAG: ABC transporter permease [Planctomycetes bacterium]|nr:ABC transporter permease [Planctomycetota bacterium]